jgi:D-alanyl-lipoteichoic acid acyltransferase DltB (MBOAT superfamily)
LRFHSPSFLALFALVFVARWTLPGWRARRVAMLLGSLLFYLGSAPGNLWVLLLCITVDFEVARRIPGASSGRRRLLVGASLATNLGLLVTFKLWARLGPESGLPLALVPLGLSFFTLQSLSYTLDVARGVVEPVRSRLDHALFVSFFPQLLAGPIVRAGDFLPQLARDPGWDPAGVRWGLSRVLMGIFQKVVVVDGVLVPIALWVAAAPTDALRTADLWTGTLAGLLVLSLDFSAYSCTAIGLGRMLGLRLPENFRFPFAATGPRDFWQRHHVTLSSWLRDYLFVPASARVGVGLATVVTMVAVGVWHHLSWTATALGAAYGVLIVVETGPRGWLRRRGLDRRGWIRSLQALGLLGVHAVLFVAVCANEMVPGEVGARVGMLVGGGAGNAAGVVHVVDQILVATLVLFFVVLHHRFRDRRLVDLAAATPGWAKAILIGLALAATFTTTQDGVAHVYFGF